MVTHKSYARRYRPARAARPIWLAAALVAGLLVMTGSAPAADPPAWVAAMRDVHASAETEPGVLVNLGDSITYSMAYFAPLQFAPQAKMPARARAALQKVDQHMQPECYRWKGVEKGNDGGKTAAWAVPRVDGWIDDLRPEVAVVMFGTNDIRGNTVARHEQYLRALVQRCLDRGVVVILTTIPPMHGYEEKVRQTVEAQRQIAADLNVPLIDFHAHIMNRRGHEWDGALPRFDGYDQWQVPTLISRDGVHLSNPDPWRQDYSEQGLCRNGNTLRNYLTLVAYAEVVDVVLKGQPPSKTTSEILGANPPVPDELPEVAAGDDSASSGALICPPQ